MAKTDPAIATSAPGATTGFDVHERPTAPKAVPGLVRTPRQDAAATTRMKAYELETLVRKESGTRRVVTAEQIKRYVREREVPDLPPPAREGATREGATLDRATMPMPEAPSRILAPSPDPEGVATLPPDLDTSTLADAALPFSRSIPRLIAAALASVDRRWFTIALIFAVAVVSALAGFVAARLEF